MQREGSEQNESDSRGKVAIVGVGNVNNIRAVLEELMQGQGGSKKDVGKIAILEVRGCIEEWKSAQDAVAEKGVRCKEDVDCDKPFVRQFRDQIACDVRRIQIGGNRASQKDLVLCTDLSDLLDVQLEIVTIRRRYANPQNEVCRGGRDGTNDRVGHAGLQGRERNCKLGKVTSREQRPKIFIVWVQSLEHCTFKGYFQTLNLYIPEKKRE
ncbi:hypothetical protein DFJ73DRAFT_758510 [Zopfochytrium polystomum]|nr:hypothetical protein DFJ73DRAFT_758510 [Zopfochytrium polystomum]